MRWEVLIEEDMEIADTFRELNYNRKNLSAGATLGIYLAGPKARIGLPVRVRSILDELYEMTKSGPKDKRPKLMQQMLDAGMSTEPFYTAKYIGKEMGDVRPSMVKKILRYFIKTRCSHSARRAFQTQSITKKAFLTAMARGRSISVMYETSKATGKPVKKQPKRYVRKAA
jgi:hypothetical protein